MDGRVRSRAGMEEDVKEATESDTELEMVIAIRKTEAPEPVSVDALLPRLFDYSFEMGRCETILDLKRRVHEVDSTPVAQMIVRLGGAGEPEVSDEKTLLQCGASDWLVVSIDFAGAERPVEVVVVYGQDRTPVVVDELDAVRDLPRKLDEMGVPHPPCFFCIHLERRIRKRSVMDDTRTFRWHRVLKGDDEIELFPGACHHALLKNKLLT